ncbi:MAG: PilZ domain-containing protein [Pseudomonadota bacterium]
MTDKRRYTRVPFDAEVHLEVNGVDHVTELIDVSLKGLLVVTPAEGGMAGGDPCRATLLLGDELAIEMECVVMHVTGTRAGLRIDRIDMESLAHLRRLLELNLGDPDLMDRELSGLGGS